MRTSTATHTEAHHEYFTSVDEKNYQSIDKVRAHDGLPRFESAARTAHVFESLSFAFAAVGRSIEAQSSVMFGGAS